MCSAMRSDGFSANDFGLPLEFLTQRARHAPLACLTRWAQNLDDHPKNACCAGWNYRLLVMFVSKDKHWVSLYQGFVTIYNLKIHGAKWIPFILSRPHEVSSWRHSWRYSITSLRQIKLSLMICDANIRESKLCDFARGMCFQNQLEWITVSHRKTLFTPILVLF